MPAPSNLPASPPMTANLAPRAPMPPMQNQFGRLGSEPGFSNSAGAGIPALVRDQVMARLAARQSPALASFSGRMPVEGTNQTMNTYGVRGMQFDQYGRPVPAGAAGLSPLGQMLPAQVNEALANRTPDRGGKGTAPSAGGKGSDFSSRIDTAGVFDGGRTTDGYGWMSPGQFGNANVGGGMDAGGMGGSYGGGNPAGGDAYSGDSTYGGAFGRANGGMIYR